MGRTSLPDVLPVRLRSGHRWFRRVCRIQPPRRLLDLGRWGRKPVCDNDLALFSLNSAPAAGAWQFPVIGIIILLMRGVMLQGENDSARAVLGAGITAALIFGYLSYRRSIEARTWKDLGFVRPAWDDLWAGLAWGAAALGLSLLMTRLPWAPSNGGTNIRLAAMTGSFAAAALCFRIACDVFGEEIIFRAYMIPRLEAMRGTTAALVISSVAFGLIHLYGAFPTTVLGLIFGAAFLRRRSIWAACLAHFTINAAVLFMVRFGL